MGYVKCIYFFMFLFKLCMNYFDLEGKEKIYCLIKYLLIVFINKNFIKVFKCLINYLKNFRICF